MTRKQKLKEQQAFDAMVQNAVEFNQWQFKNLKPLTDEELQKHEEDMIKQIGKKGLNFILCKNPKATLCQNQNNRRVCESPKLAPSEFLICGSCRYSFKVRDGLIWMDEQ
jgi:predicted PilT family ATPase